MTAKKPWQSKTLIVNFLVALFALTGLSEKISVNPEQMMMILTGVNIVLRLLTKDKIGLES